MSFQAKLLVNDGTATIRMAGSLDSLSAPQLNELINEAADRAVSRLVMLMEGLTYLSSAGLRCLVYGHQRMPDGTQFILVGAQPAVAETIKLTGFDRSVVMQEPGATW
jgi:anti-anti-sigma factor